MRLRAVLLTAVTFLLSFAHGQSQTIQEQVRDFRKANEQRLLSEFLNLLSVPNIASDRVNIRKNAELIMQMMKQRGLDPRLLEAPTPNTPPAVFAELKTPGATRTLILYAHYDGQPTDPKQWSGSLPWQPVFRSAALEADGKTIPTPNSGDVINPEWRIYGRSTSDDKAGVMTILTAFEALKAKGIALTSNIKFFFEGEE
ncbi:MAG TPA: M20/M25/M40 family metallo-hydrolase, partial [Pyrinomonadaceae bacterium]